MDSVAPPGAEPRAADVEHRTLERVKELDHEHRSRLRAAPGLTLRLRFLRTAWARLRSDTAPAHCDPVTRPMEGSLSVTFVGHGSVLLSTPQTRVLCDPMFANTLFGLRRAQEAGIAQEDVAEVSLVLLSHAHHDHLHRPSLRRIPRAATLVVPPRCAELVSDLGFARVLELGIGSAFGADDIEVTAVPARHDGIRGGLDQTPRGVCGYIVKTPDTTVYFAGDTAYFSGLGEIGRRFRPDIALLPIGGYEPADFREEHMSPLDAAFALEDLGAQVMIPIGFGSFPLSYEPLDAPRAWLEEIARERNLVERLRILGHGDTLTWRAAKDRPPV